MTCEYGLEKIMRYLDAHRELVDREIEKINKEVLDDKEL